MAAGSGEETYSQRLKVIRNSSRVTIGIEEAQMEPSDILEGELTAP